MTHGHRATRRHAYSPRMHELPSIGRLEIDIDRAAGAPRPAQEPRIPEYFGSRSCSHPELTETPGPAPTDVAGWAPGELTEAFGR